MMLNLLKTLFTVGLIVLAYWLGGWLERQDAIDQRLMLESYCPTKGHLERFVAPGYGGFVCFTKNVQTKRITSAIIVIDGP